MSHESREVAIRAEMDRISADLKSMLSGFVGQTNSAHARDALVANLAAQLTPGNPEVQVIADPNDPTAILVSFPPMELGHYAIIPCSHESPDPKTP